MKTISVETHEQICQDMLREIRELISGKSREINQAYQRGYWQAVEDVLRSGVEAVVARNTNIHVKGHDHDV